MTERKPSGAAWRFDDDTDVETFARNVLKGRAGGGRPGDLAPAEALFRGYAELEGSPHRDRLSDAVATCLTDAEPEVRSGALSFFEKFPQAAGAERVLALAKGDRALFRGGELGFQLMRGVGAQVLHGVAEALELARHEALEPGDPFPLIAALTQADPDWVVEHAEAIVGATPTTGLPILFNLQALGRSLLDVGRRIAPLAKRDRQFAKRLDRFIRDDEVRAVLRRAMRAR